MKALEWLKKAFTQHIPLKLLVLAVAIVMTVIFKSLV